jgi:hypothetical protein
MRMLRKEQFQGLQVTRGERRGPSKPARYWCDLLQKPQDANQVRGHGQLASLPLPTEPEKG